MTAFRWGDASDIGQIRENNQDLALVTDEYFAVADGMGGHSGGETAARIAIDTLADRFTETTLDALVETVEVANERVVQQAEADPELRGMGTTLCVLAAVTYDETEVVAVVNVGDSRAYLVDDDELVQLTKDHTLVQMLVDQGQLRPAEAEHHPQRNILTRALGIDARVVVDSFLLRPVAGDRYLLCSDGLYGEIDTDEMLAVLTDEPDPAVAASRLVEEANRAGGHDNVTCIVVDVTEGVDGGVVEDHRVIESDADEHADIAPVAPVAAVTSEGADDEPGAVVDDEAPPDVEDDRVDGDHPAGEAVASTAAPVPPPAAPARPRRFTWRTGLFLVLLLVVVGLAIGATAFYARSTYFVGEQAGEVVIFRGRPGGALWFDPTIEDTTDIAVEDLPPALRREVEEGKDQPTLGDADRYVANLRDELERIEEDQRSRSRTSDSSDAGDEPQTTTTAVTTGSSTG